MVVIATAACFIADAINAVLARSIAPAIDPPAPAAQRTPTSAMAQNYTQLAHDIASSGLFPPAAPGLAQAGGREGGRSTAPPIDAGKKIKLMGTVVGEGVSALAVIQHVAGQRQALYHLHETIPDVGELAEVRPTSILVRLGDQSETMDLPLPPPPAGIPAPPASAGGVVIERAAAPKAVPVEPPIKPLKPPGQPVAAPLPPTLSQDGRPIRRIIARQDAAAVPRLTDLNQVRAEPVMDNGKLTGFQFNFYRVDSIFQKVGLYPGDIVKEVNGVPVNRLEVLDRFFQGINKEKSVRLNILRGGQNAILTAEIQ